MSIPNRQTFRLEFWHGVQVEVYVGQVCRSRSSGKGQGHKVKNMDLPKKLRNMAGNGICGFITHNLHHSNIVFRLCTLHGMVFST